MTFTQRLARLLLAALLLGVLLPAAAGAAPAPAASSPARAAPAAAPAQAPSLTETCLPQVDVYPLSFRATELDGIAVGEVLTVSLPLDTPELGGFVAWVDDSTNATIEGFGPGGSLHNGFAEDIYQSTAGPVEQINGAMEVGDWIKAKIGSVSSASSTISWHVTNQTVMRLPLIDQSNGGGNALTYRFSKMARFNLLAFSLLTTGSGRYFTLRYLGDEPGVACGGSREVTLVNTLLDDSSGQPAGAITGTMALYAEGAPFISAPFQADPAGVYTFTLTLPMSVPLLLEHSDMAGYRAQFYQGGASMAQATPIEVGSNTAEVLALTTRLVVTITCLPQTDVFPLTFSPSLLAGMQPGEVLTVELALEQDAAQWLMWMESSASASALEEAWGPHGSLGEGFEEHDHQLTAGPADQRNGLLEPGDWVSVLSGAVSRIANELSWHIDSETVLRLPLSMEIYAGGSGGGNTAAVKFSQMSRFQLLAYDLTAALPEPFVSLRYLGEEPGVACRGHTNVQIVNELVPDPTSDDRYDTGKLVLYADGSPYAHAYFMTDPAGVFTVTLTLPISTPLKLEYSALDWDPSGWGYPTQYYNLSPTLQGADALTFGPDTSSVALQTYLSTFQRICAPQFDVFPLTFDPALLGGMAPGDVLTVTTHAFLDWDGGSNSAGQLDASWAEHGSLFGSFVESPETHQQQYNGTLEFGDWMWSQTGAVSQIADELDQHIDEQTVMYLPLSGEHSEAGSRWTYHFTDMARFNLLAYNLTDAGQGRYVTLRYLGDEAGTPCEEKTIVNTLLDVETGEPITNTTGVLELYDGLAPLARRSFTTDAGGVFTTTVSVPAGRPVALKYLHVDRGTPENPLAEYPHQFYGGAFMPVEEAQVALDASLTTLVTRLSWRRPFCYPARDIYPLALDSLDVARLMPGDTLAVQIGPWGGRWLSWTGDQSEGVFAAAWTGGGTLRHGFAEHPFQASTSAASQYNGLLEPYDLLQGYGGPITGSALLQQLDDHSVGQRTLGLPLLEEARYSAIGLFTLTGYDFSGAEPTLSLTYRGLDAAEGCGRNVVWLPLVRAPGS